MADKFTRSGNVEGDIWYATTASSSKSLESLEDNIDDKMVAYIGSDSTGGTNPSSTSETKIGEVIIPANSARNRFLIIAAVGFLNGNSVVGATGNVRIRTGTSVTATSNTERKITHFTIGTINIDMGGFIMTTITTSNETFTGQIYVHVTGENNVNASNVYCKCESIYVLGI